VPYLQQVQEYALEAEKEDEARAELNAARRAENP